MGYYVCVDVWKERWKRESVFVRVFACVCVCVCVCVRYVFAFSLQFTV